jgi:hypothetical protein
MTPLTEEQFKAALPAQIKKSVNPSLMKMVNQTLSSTEAMESFKENLLTYTSVMMDGRFKITSYISAVKYVSFKLLGSTNIAAYSKTFPDKIARFKAQGVSDKDMSSYAAAFNKSKLVNLIFEQTLVPTHVLNAPLFQKAINVQAELMLTAHSEKVRSDAAACLIKELKPPETQKVELDIGTKTDKTLETLRASTMELVKQQKAMIASGASNAKNIAAGSLVIVRDSDQ